MVKLSSQLKVDSQKAREGRKERRLAELQARQDEIKSIQAEANFQRDQAEAERVKREVFEKEGFSIDNYREEYNKLSPNVRKFFAPPERVEAAEAERVAAEKEKLYTKISEVENKIKQANEEIARIRVERQSTNSSAMRKRQNRRIETIEGNLTGYYKELGSIKNGEKYIKRGYSAGDIISYAQDAGEESMRRRELRRTEPVKTSEETAFIVEEYQDGKYQKATAYSKGFKSKVGETTEPLEKVTITTIPAERLPPPVFYSDFTSVNKKADHGDIVKVPRIINIFEDINKISLGVGKRVYDSLDFSLEEPSEKYGIILAPLTAKSVRLTSTNPVINKYLPKSKKNEIYWSEFFGKKGEAAIEEIGKLAGYPALEEKELAKVQALTQQQFEYRYGEKIASGQISFEEAVADFEKSEDYKKLQDIYSTELKKAKKSEGKIKYYSVSTGMVSIGLLTEIMGKPIQTITEAALLGYAIKPIKAFFTPKVAYEYEILGKKLRPSQEKAIVREVGSTSGDLQIIKDLDETGKLKIITETPLTKINLSAITKIDETVTVGRKAIVTTQARNTFKLPPIYSGVYKTRGTKIKGVDYFYGSKVIREADAGYNKALKKLKSQGLTEYQARSTLRNISSKRILSFTKAVGFVPESNLSKIYLVGERTTTTSYARRKGIKTVKLPFASEADITKVDIPNVDDLYYIFGYGAERGVGGRAYQFGGFTLPTKATKFKVGRIEVPKTGGKKITTVESAKEYIQKIEFGTITGAGKAKKFNLKNIQVNEENVYKINKIFDTGAKEGIGGIKFGEPSVKKKIIKTLRDIENKLDAKRVAEEKARLKYLLEQQKRFGKTKVSHIDKPFPEVSFYTGTGEYEQTVTGVPSQVLAGALPKTNIRALPIKKRIGGLPREVVIPELRFRTSFRLGGASKIRDVLKERTSQRELTKLENKYRLKEILREIVVLRQPQKQEEKLTTTQLSRLYLSPVPKPKIDLIFNVPRPTLKPPKPPRFRFIIPRIGNDEVIKAEIKKKMQIKETKLGLIPDFTSRALGLESEKLILSDVDKAVREVKTGFELRRGVKLY